MTISKFKKIYLTIPLALFLLIGWGITFYFLIQSLGSIWYIPALFEEEASAICKYKRTIWGDTTYKIQTTPISQKASYLPEPLYLHVEEYNKERWGYLFDTISGNQLIGEAVFSNERFEESKYKKNLSKHFTFCTTTITSPRPYGPAEIRNDATGVVISVRNNKTHVFARLTMSVGLLAFRYTDEDYDFDAAMKDLAQSFVLEEEQNGKLKLLLKVNYDIPKAFHYEITKVNDKFIDTNNLILISEDQGKTWNPVISNSEQ